MVRAAMMAVSAIAIGLIGATLCMASLQAMEVAGHLLKEA